MQSFLLLVLFLNSLVTFSGYFINPKIQIVPKSSYQNFETSFAENERFRPAEFKNKNHKFKNFM